MARSSLNYERLDTLWADLQASRVQILDRRLLPPMWAVSQRVALYDSIYRGLPIPPVYLWRTTNHDGLRVVTPRNVPADLNAECFRFLIDGQQRVLALAEGLFAPSAAECNIFCSLADGIVFFHRSERAPIPEDMPMSVIFTPEGDKWISALPLDILKSRARHVRTAFFDFRLIIQEVLQASLVELGLLIKRLHP